MFSRVCGSFFEGLHDRRILRGVVRARSQFSPFVTMQQAVDVVDGNLVAELFRKCGSQLLGGQQIAALGLRQMLGKEGTLLL